MRNNASLSSKKIPFCPLRQGLDFGVTIRVAIPPLRQVFGGCVRLCGLAHGRRERGVLQLLHLFTLENQMLVAFSVSFWYNIPQMSAEGLR